MSKNEELITEARRMAARMGDATTIGSLFDEMADALEAATTPRTIISNEDLATLPVGVLVLRKDGSVWRTNAATAEGSGYMEPAHDADPDWMTNFNRLSYPAMVIHTPESALVDA